MSAHYISSLSQSFSLPSTEPPAAAALSAVQVLRPLSILAALALKGMSQSGARQSTSSSYYGSQPT